MSLSNVKTKTGLYLTIVIAMMLSCKNQAPRKTVDAVQVHMNNSAVQYELLNRAQWLIGSWKGVIGEGVSVENWYKQDDSTYVGAGLFIKGNVNLSEESVKLYQRGKDLYYEPTVKGQNNGKPITFKMVSISAKKMIFENPQHDFPQKITYVQMAEDSMVATISGIDKGMMRAENFPMTRKK